MALADYMPIDSFDWKRKDLIFRFPAKTSRNTLTAKPGWILTLSSGENTGYGEVSLIPRLSPEMPRQIEEGLSQLTAENINAKKVAELSQSHPALAFGLETALLDLQGGGKHRLYDTPFSRGDAGIRTNGLVWMGSAQKMSTQIQKKIRQGFTCIKLKVGGLAFDKDLRLIEQVRNDYSSSVLEIRLDANGAFPSEKALSYLERLAKFDIHSIEQPLAPNSQDPSALAKICAESPIPIALDEELHGLEVNTIQSLLAAAKPRYVVLKPSLLGGLAASDRIIKIAEELSIQWWSTSALEGNLGLNAIAQWVSSYAPGLVQGLGTGGLFTNNIASPLEIIGQKLFYKSSTNWDTP